MVETFRKAFYEELKKQVKEHPDYFDFTGFDFPITPKFPQEFKEAYFSNAIFRSKIALDTVLIEGEFKKVIFHGDADFTGTIFYGDADFSFVKFQRAEFIDAEFHGDANFTGTVFHGDANFTGTSFQRTRFSATFHGYANFRRSRFYENAFFQDCIFRSVTNFSYVVFEEQVFLSTRGIKKKRRDLVSILLSLSSKEPNPILLFFSTSFKKPKSVQILGYPLSRISFLLTDLSDILLVPAREKEDKILDEMLLHRYEKTNSQTKIVNDKSKPRSTDIRDYASLVAVLGVAQLVTWEALIVEYKTIRKNLENNRLFNEASNLFVREMQLSRMNLSWGRDFFEKVAHHVYGWISRYGESVNRPVIITLGFITGMAFFLLLSLGSPADLFTNRLGGMLKYLEAVSSVFIQIRSFRDFDFLKDAPLALEILIRVTSLLCLGTFFIAVRRRLERK